MGCAKTWIRITAIAFLLAPLLICLWAFEIEPARLVVRHQRIELPGWRSDLRIAVMSDLHVGAPHVGLDQLRRIVQRTNAENPAVIVLLGDFVIGGPGGHGGVGNFVEPEQIADELKKLRAPFGVFAVLGNHDWWVDGEHVRRALTSAGIRVLENQAVRMGGDAHGPAFWLGGIGDLWTRHADIPGTLRQVDGDDPVVLITHNPDLFPEVPPRVSLTLAGHTHGGQVNLPLFGRVVTVSERGYGAGEIVEQGRHLFVTTGIGTSIIPVRFGVPPEIVILTVSQAKSR